MCLFEIVHVAETKKKKIARNTVYKEEKVVEIVYQKNGMNS